jgi:hypothetical protein
MSIVVYVLNRCPMKSMDGMTPFEAWHKKKLVVHHLRMFGVHHMHPKHEAAPEEAGGPWLQDDLHRL